ncbi:hypothetical protein BDN72DRAFT_877733 [Pluteus cervinus]|uniref:Uncharacterized protein n=1 Tax=Pluteus cervinus TaxID=181527 RepID=A0ACD3AZ51_9AGAR|nr:hypothetical protein BDN72DRAFT_877733 [Pluteus cervinus]
MTRPSKVAPILPPEILDQVFQYVLIPHYLVDSVFLPRPESPWFKNMRQKKALLLVCSSWYNSALRLLYQDITIHHIGPIIALSKVLGEKPERLGCLVRSISAHCYVPHTFVRLLGVRMQVILDSCPALTHLAYFPILSEHYCRVRLPISPSLTHLTLRGLVRYENISPILEEVRETLTYLSFLWCRTLHVTSITFPALHTLICSHDPVDDHRFAVPLTEKDVDQDWAMPSLRVVTFEFSEGWTFDRTTPANFHLDMITRFCRRHGGSITSLSTRAIQSAEPAVASMTHIGTFFNHFRIQDALDHCPSLKSLGVHWHNWISNLEHPKLEYLDLWYQTLGHLNLNWRLPAIQKVRLVENCLLSTFPAFINTFPDSLPVDIGDAICVCEHYASSGITMREYPYEDLVEVLEGKEIICLHRPHREEDEKDDDDASSSDYNPSEEESSDDYHSDNSSAISLDLNDALERFTQSLQATPLADPSDESD